MPQKKDNDEDDDKPKPKNLALLQAKKEEVRMNVKSNSSLFRFLPFYFKIFFQRLKSEIDHKNGFTV